MHAILYALSNNAAWGLMFFQIIISSAHTNGTVSGLAPFATYNCSLVIHAISTTNGVISDTITVTTGESDTGMYMHEEKLCGIFQLLNLLHFQSSWIILHDIITSF